MNDSDLPAHSPLGPSALSRVLACPGSFLLSESPEVKALARYRPSIYAARGTVAHRVAERLLAGDTITRETVAQAGYDIDIDDAMVEAVEIYTEVTEPLLAAADWHAVEKRVSLDRYWTPPDTPPVAIFGTADFLAYHATTRRLTVCDYKHGTGVVVSAVDNPQTLAYAAGALTLVPGPVDDVDLVIVQPNAPGNKVRRWSLTAVDVLMWVHDTLLPGIRRAQDEPGTYVAGPQCRFCPATPLCPHLHAKATEQAMAQFALPNELISGEQLAARLADAEAAEIWIDAIRDLAKRRLEELPDDIPGWGLFPTRPTRSWDDSSQVEATLLHAGVPAHEYLETKLRSPAQLQKRLKPGFWAAIAAHIQSVSSGTKLSRRGD